MMDTTKARTAGLDLPRGVMTVTATCGRQTGCTEADHGLYGQLYSHPYNRCTGCNYGLFGAICTACTGLYSNLYGDNYNPSGAGGAYGNPHRGFPVPPLPRSGKAGNNQC